MLFRFPSPFVDDTVTLCFPDGRIFSFIIHFISNTRDLISSDSSISRLMSSILHVETTSSSRALISFNFVSKRCAIVSNRSSFNGCTAHSSSASFVSVHALDFRSCRSFSIFVQCPTLGAMLQYIEKRTNTRTRDSIEEQFTLALISICTRI